MSRWRWLSEAVVLAGQEEQIAEHGGRAGLREPGMLQSALARPVNLAAYGDPDIAALAAAYGYGIARNHPFIDGNKRTALLVMESFLIDNGFELRAPDMETLATIMRLADGSLPEADLAAWLRRHIAPL